MSEVKVVLDSNFAEKIEESKGISLVDFWGEGCGPCVQLAPVLDELSTEMKGVNFYKMDVYDNPEKPSQLRIRGIPTIILFKDGKQIATKVGFASKNDLKAWIEEQQSA